MLPGSALLFTGTVILGEGPLKDLALALFVGMISGAYSSIFIATPLLAQLKEREPEMKKLASRVAARRSKDQKARDTAPVAAVEPSPKPKPVPAATAALVDPEPDETPSEDAELADAAVSSRTGIRISRVESGSRPDLRPTSEGAAKRPQPQHKPRSQRKK